MLEWGLQGKKWIGRGREARGDLAVLKIVNVG